MTIPFVVKNHHAANLPGNAYSEKLYFFSSIAVPRQTIQEMPNSSCFGFDIALRKYCAVAKVQVSTNYGALSRRSS
ncbi:hypothetical protein ACWYXK_08625 [Janthinobacterium lividum]|jgi:hypothetical protein|uniref:hypothetical protein n=1 Tax=Janthinobacterium TaxID=29580 RepID=UPI00111305D3|nr:MULTISPECIES: hypothetical protein [Janthinobacterium]MCC7696802.1 hypothetical protein [Janthinobacterium sp. EB271-G4-7A]MCC7712244.1 hypothetical protein [Janthinobacterium lividum]WQE27080.1 hypothetical protein U0004_18975 [Janthinobacterium lividum]